MVNNLTKEQYSALLLEQRENFTQKDIGVEREQLPQLVNYLNDPYVVVISGVRRVGKSTLLRQLALNALKNDYFVINFEDERLLNFSVSDFDRLHEILIEEFGERNIWLIDEIQNVQGWERFVRRLADQGHKFFITGSNASLLSQELGTKLTGRHITVELLPFSFNEYLKLIDKKLPSKKSLTTTERAKFQKLLTQYVKQGGIADAIKYPELTVHKHLYDDIIYRDVATRYQIDAVKNLKELAFHLISNISGLVSFNKLKELLKVGSVNTIKSYIEYLESSWLIFIINKYAYSVKTQQIAPKKIYAIDTGLVNSVGFSFSQNKGKLLENLVFLQLKRSGKQIYYYQTQIGHEVDFYIPESGLLVQVCQQFDSSTADREIRALEEASKELGKDIQCLILAENIIEDIKSDKTDISTVPINQWLLHGY